MQHEWCKTLSLHLDFVKLSASDVLVALKNARKRLVRGGRIHDYLHAVAAEKGLATKILTLDKYDFDDLTSHEVEVVCKRSL